MRKNCLPCNISQKTYIIWFSFMVHMCKMIISKGIFKIFSKFWFSRLLGGKRAKNSPKWQKILSVTPSISQEPYIIWLSFMLHLCKMIISLGNFFIFFKILIFWVVREVNGQKMVLNGKKFYPLHTISEESYIIMTVIYVYKMIIPSCVFSIFFFFEILIFWVHRGINCPEWQKIMSVALHISGTIYHMIVIYGASA